MALQQQEVRQWAFLALAFGSSAKENDEDMRADHAEAVEGDLAEEHSISTHLDPSRPTATS